MEAAARDTTQDWLLPEHSRPPLIGELEQRIEEALVTARASEAAVMTVGASALDAAEQARRAAELAERASASALDARRDAAAAVEGSRASGGAVQGAPSAAREPEAGGEGDLGDFSERADRLVARLRQLQRVPLADSPASGDAGRSQPAR